MIKKVLAAMLTAVILMSVPVVADFDLSSMTLDELVDLKNEISKEIQDRITEEGNFGGGGYLVGTDIKAGHYVYTPINNGAAYISLFPDKEAFDKSRETQEATEAILSQQVYEVNHDCLSLNLEDGQYLYVNGGPGILTENNASWLP